MKIVCLIGSIYCLFFTTAFSEIIIICTAVICDITNRRLLMQVEMMSWWDVVLFKVLGHMENKKMGYIKLQSITENTEDLCLSAELVSLLLASHRDIPVGVSALFCKKHTWDRVRRSLIFFVHHKRGTWRPVIVGEWHSCFWKTFDESLYSLREEELIEFMGVIHPKKSCQNSNLLQYGGRL